MTLDRCPALSGPQAVEGPPPFPLAGAISSVPTASVSFSNLTALGCQGFPSKNSWDPDFFPWSPRAGLSQT